MVEFVATNITACAGQRRLVDDAGFFITSGQLWVVLGPNGAGKTTLIECAMGLKTPDAGGATVDGLNTRSMSARQRAQIIGYLPQEREIVWPMRVRDMVAIGRFAHGLTTTLSARDFAAVARAMSSCGLGALADRRVDTLSGGEKARVHCARVLCSETPILVADEPVAALDPAHAYQLMRIIRNFVERGGAALVVLHDVSLAAAFATHLMWMREGNIVAQGSVADQLQSSLCESIYGMRLVRSGRTVALSEPT